MRTPALVLLLALVTSASLEALAANMVGQVTHLSGVLVVKRVEGGDKLLSVKSEIQEGDQLSTQQESYARIKFVDGAELVLRPTTQIKVSSYSFNQAKPASDNVLINMVKGGFRAVTGLIGKRNREAVSFNTSTATIGIRGTHFGALLCQDDCADVPTSTGKPPLNGLHLDVPDGSIIVRNGAGQLVINMGQFGFVGGPNIVPVIVPPQQANPVTMPQIISQNKNTGGIGKGKEGECVAQ